MALAALFAACSGDDDGDCGPGDAAGDLAVVLPNDAEVSFGGLHAGANNDCPFEGAPTSITIAGTQSTPEGTGFLTLCLPQPDQIGSAAIDLDSGDLIQVVDLVGEDADGCEVRVDRADGLGDAIATFEGVCDDGVHPDGFAVSLSGALTFSRTCGADLPELIDVVLSGRAPVSADAT